MAQITNHYLSWIDSDKELHCEALLLTKNKIRIGRSKHVDIEVFNNSVSREHLELSWEDENLRIMDLNSSYGTWVENIKLNKGECKFVNADTEIRLGNLSMWYEIRHEDESQEMMQTVFHSTNATEDIGLSKEINNFRVRLQSLLQENFGDNTINIQLISGINDELLQLIGKQERRLKEQRILNSISHVLNRSLTVCELLKTSLNLVSKVLNAERGFVVLLEESKYSVYAERYFENISWETNGSILKNHSQILVDNCFRQKEVIIIGDTELNHTLKDLESVKNGGGRSIVVIPLIQDENVIGVIYLDNQQLPYNFDAKQVPFLTTYAAHTSIALHNSFLYKRAITDDLTQLFTRQHIDESLKKEILRAQNTNQELSVLILDLDHFKNVNDTYGHTTGDDVLKMFSSILKGHIRDHDTAGRFGGEEFIAILPNTNIDKAKDIAERIRKAVESKIITKEKNLIKITVSIGVARYSQEHHTKALLLIEDADKALYKAKENGRNRSVCFS